jgi:general secretion pathway protein F
MALYVYKAYDKAGKLINGTMEANEKTAVISKLQQSNFYPLRVEEEGKRPSESSITADLVFRFKLVKTKDVVTFTQQLASLLEAGVQLDRSLTILTELTENKKLANVIKQVQLAVHGGSSFTDALARHTRVFSRLYINMIRAGESGGVLELVVSRLAEFLENTQKLKDDITSALIYPSLLTLVAGSAVAILLTFVVPRFSHLFADMGQALPMATQLLLTISGFIRHYWWLILLSIAAAVFSFKYYVTTESGRMSWDTWKLKWPLIGPLIQKIEVSRFSRTLGTMIKSGVPILQGLAIVKEVINNTLISKSMLNIQSGLKEGEGISAPLRESGHFPPLALHMISIGEETGQLDQMLLKVADAYDIEIRTTVNRLIALLEPAMILIMGLIVGFIVVAMLLAVFSVNEVPF